MLDSHYLDYAHWKSEMLEGHDSLDVARRVNVSYQSVLDRLERRVTVGDKGSDVDFFSLDQIQRAKIHRRAPVWLEASRGSDGSDEAGLSEHQIVQHAQVDPGVAV